MASRVGDIDSIAMSGTGKRKSSTVEIPQSPKRAKILENDVSQPKSRFGLDKGMRASMVSLKAPKSAFSHGKTHGAKSVAAGIKRESRPGKSFSERLTNVRDIGRQLKENNQKKSIAKRSLGFGFAQRSSRESEQKAGASKTGTRVLERDREKSPDENIECGEKCAYSKFHLRKRTTSTQSLETAFENKTLLSIPKLLAEVKSPEYVLPDSIEDGDYVIFGIIAQKSTPRNHADTSKSTKSDSKDEDKETQRSKFMVLKLVDLKWEVDLFLFDTGFEAFWKLTVGTVVAVLNPAIMKPKPHMQHSGQFSLKLASSEDTIIEIGPSNDLAFCKSMKRNGEQCSQWIDGRKTEFCDYHVNIQIEKTKSSRMEVNTMSPFDLFGKDGSKNSKKSSRQGNFRGRGGFSGRGGHRKMKGDGKGQYYDSFAQEIAYNVPFGSASTTRMLDAESYIADGLTKNERSQKRLAAAEKERALAKSLGSLGSGVGRQYMRAKIDSKERGEGAQLTFGPSSEPPDAGSLGLIGKPKDASTLCALGGSSLNAKSSKHQPFGWGFAFKRGLPTDSIRTSQSNNKPSKAHREQSDPKHANAKQRDAKTQDATQQKPKTAILDDEDDDLDII